MNRKHYLRISRIANGVLVFASVGIVWTLIRGSNDRRDSAAAVHGGFDFDDDDGAVVAPLPTDWKDYPTEGPPYIGAADNSEMIVLPWPETPDILMNRPHADCDDDDDDDGRPLVSWSDVGPHRPYQNVTIPDNTRVVLRRRPDVYEWGVLTIPATSELRISPDENEDDVTLYVRGIVVHGTLTIGTETCPVGSKNNNKVIITLHGDRPDDARYRSDVDPSYKGVYVPAGGRLRMHGKTYFPTWTRLSRTVNDDDNNNSSVLFLQHAVNWEPGQEVVVITSALKDSRDWHQNEKRTVAAVYTATDHDRVGSVITLTEPLRYRHVGHGSYQTEVGLLSRNIVVQGDARDSEPIDPDPRNCRMKPDQLPYLGYDESMGAQCPDTETTGYGGHILVETGGEAQVEGVELVRMGKTNVMNRYPFQLYGLGDDCPHCYFRRSSIHRSYYRGVVVQGTNSTTVSENVAYDVIGYCFMLMDGVEENNTLSYNLAAHIHWLGPEPADSVGREKPVYTEEDGLAFVADVSASPFYIPNAWNTIVGNAASGGWAGFHILNMDRPLNAFRDYDWSPASRPSLLWDGNTAHSTAFWWRAAAAVYVGGWIRYGNDGKLEYSPGKEISRDMCTVRKLAGDCKPDEFAFLRITNTKVFLTTVFAWHSQTGRFEIDGFEAHDTGPLQENGDRGFWMNRVLHACRSGERLELPEAFNTKEWSGSSMYWQTEGFKYIISNSIFRNCGVRDEKYDQYNDSPTRGCPADGSNTGCKAGSAVFYWTSFKDNLLPEIVEITTNITYDNCGRRFMSTYEEYETNMAMRESWIDADGSASGLGVPAFIVSGTTRSRAWWRVDDEAVLEPQRPLYFIRKDDGPKRALAHVQMRWDDALHDQIGFVGRYCYQKAENCPEQGVLRHLGKRFTPDPDDYSTWGLPITAVGKVTGFSGGYGWLLEFNRYGAPKDLSLERMEIDPDSVLMLTIKYPRFTTFRITASTKFCVESWGYLCSETFEQTDDLEEVRRLGNKYYVHPNGFLTLRLVQTSSRFVGFDADGDGDGEWIIPDWDTPGRKYEYALDRFERAGVRLPQFSFSANLRIEATCAGGGKYCTGDVAAYDPAVCPQGYTQIGYDRCCRNGNTDCVYPDDTSLHFV